MSQQTLTTSPRDEAAVVALAHRIPGLWAEVTSGHSAPEAIAAVFTEDASFIVGDGTFLGSRAEIAAYFQRMVEGSDPFGTTIRDTTVTFAVDRVRFLSESAAVMVGHGGILFPGESEVPPERRGRQTVVVTKEKGDWLAAAYQNTRIWHDPGQD